METKTGNCSCGKRSVVLRRVGDSYLCASCAATSPDLSEAAKRQLSEETNGGKETLMD